MFVATLLVKEGMAEQVREDLEELSRNGGNIRAVEWPNLYHAKVSIGANLPEDIMPLMEKIRSLGGVRSAKFELVT